MRILLTGATGFIGRRLGKALLAKGHNLVILTRNVQDLEERFPYPAEAHAWTGRGEPPKAALERLDAIIHLAGESVGEQRWTKEQKQKILHSRIDSTRHLLRAVAKHTRPAPKVVLSASAIGYYGADRGNAEISESAEPGTDFLAEVSREWEKEVFTAPLPNEVRRAVLRTGIVLGPEGGALKKLVPLAKLGLLGRLGSGKQWLSWIHIDDLVAQYIRLLEDSTLSGAFNGVAPQPRTNAEFTRALAKTLGVWQAPPVPRIALRLVAGEMANVLLGSLRIQAKRFTHANFQFRFASLENALHDLLHEQSKYDEFIAEQWFQTSPTALFPFFADERNLERITPEFLQFQVVGKSTVEIAEGTLIDYRLRIHGVPVKWRTRIEAWSPPKEFVDTQICGPYSHWQHTHRFEPFAGGTLMRDRVLYKVPFGYLGRLVAGYFVAQDVKRIFQYRRKTIRASFS